MATKTKTVKKPALTIEQVIPGYRAGKASAAGILLDAKTKKPYLLELLDAKAPKRMNWKDALAWAKKQKADLPSRPELNLLRATLRDKFQDASYWSNEPNAGLPSCAWCQYFYNGSQWSLHESNELLAVAVRRTPL